jgi:hypothetical protein
MSTRKRKHTSADSASIATELLRVSYYMLDTLQTPFDWVFWLIERPKTRIWNELKGQGGDQ